jgi:starch-binding outer membrane protein, SusD/RagB family
MRAYTSRVILLGGLAVAIAVGGCQELTVPDLNNPGLDELTETPTRSSIETATQGLMLGARRGIGEFNRYVSTLGVLGRESYNFDGSDPRFIVELLQGPLDPGGASFGGSGHWADRYANIRAANILLASLAPAADLFTAQELEAIRGFAKTLQAHDFLLVINTRDEFGAPIAVDIDPTGPPAPIASKSDVLQHIVALLDQAETHLNAAGDAFPFELSSGFSAHGNFTTPASFLRFNRALKARVRVYQEDWSGALIALGASFLNDDPGQGLAGLNAGVYHAYGTGPGDRANALFGRREVLPAHPSLAADAQAGDQRLTRKTEVLATPVTAPGEFALSSNRLFRIYGSLSAPIPIIRNEELLLLRAEARLRTGDAQARDDINLVRTISGGLTPIDVGTWTVMTEQQRIDELLYNRRYSLLFEGHRWIDMRRYDRLEDLPVDHPSFKRFPAFPIPAIVCVGRSPTPAGCSVVAGF